MRPAVRPADVEAREPRTIGASEPVNDGYPGALLAHLDVSVVVPTWRRPDLLRTCLDALVRQDFEPSRYEIVVCDDGPDDATRATVDAFAAEHRPRGVALRYVAVTATQGPAGARNAGWRAARAPLIAFTDDDTQPAADWLRAGVAALDRADAAAGRIVVPLDEQPTDYELDASGLAHAEFATANAFVRRTLLVQTGGFDERFTAAWREDSDLQFTLLRAGAEVVRADDALVVHPVRPARWGVSLAQQKKSRYDALLFRKHPQLYRQRISSGPPLLYYAILCAALWGLVALLFDRVDVALGALAVWLVLTAGFCVRRLRGTRRSVAHVAEMAWTSLWIPFLSIFWRLNGAVRYRVWFL
ncbi:glycosyltransferase [Paraburkholderia caballeronis]|uniref:Glycosyltransferase, catalytic subunit of cellulose synthase and poly-beta-1,6-N-acetylglucosamine synthase n=1 Tax=Paraburkholderia caballeronis TaxID=416943 RepID=A0A1H7J3Z1_9BURK|nr:glycosyltransferase [Paraburkholderia caballeronis]PXW27569.1 cellulose synthase/poly-beta-1,6-N-acetylglucosamine synthase-like glycosyltransferase [Paraburkholderia caballeronis]PXX03043.1 cellulose synthase/poly-beta-1,6-N-acetylglucosamine synthase-like glycosyltransferase [Paraburkholderia caballeronis]RAK03768.1 cellulose synthase/poly-beta-1,6-N-acetylglucosamine synthase-like glycosyltransferase [Paraburkholderia caballeronis]TDV21059.1 cellulose synthase/poly-beta-1,6-N-acetylglucos